MSAEKNWRLRGQCLDVDPDLMFPDSNTADETEAKDQCRGCPVAAECFLDSIDKRDFEGVRAGMTGKERKAWYEANVPGAVKPRKRVAA